MQCKFSILLRCCDCAQAKSALLLKNGSNLSSRCFIFLEQCNCTNATLFIAKTPDKVGNTSTRPPGHLRLSPTLGCVVQLGASRFAPRARYPDVWQRPAACCAGPHHHSLLIQTLENISRSCCAAWTTPAAMTSNQTPLRHPFRLPASK